MTASGSLIRASPEFVLNTGIPNKFTINAWAAVAVGSRSAYSSQVALLTSLSDDKCANAAV
jgi:hypothetical protein